MEQETTITEVPEDYIERLDIIISQQSEILECSADSLEQLTNSNLYLQDINTLNLWFCGLLGIIIGVLFVNLLKK